MTEFSSFPLFVKDIFKKHPEVFAPINIDEIEAQGKKNRAARDAANPPKADSPQAELNRLRAQLFQLQNNAKGTEQLVNNEAGNVKEYERRLGVVLKTKKEYEEAGNLVAARNCEHSAQKLETDLLDSQPIPYSSQC